MQNVLRQIHMSQEFEHFDYIGSNEKRYDFFLGDDHLFQIDTISHANIPESLDPGINIDLVDPAETDLDSSIEVPWSIPFNGEVHNVETFAMIEEIAAGHGIVPYPHDKDASASYQELSEDYHSMLSRTMDAIEKDGHTAAVLIAVDKGHGYGRGPMLGSDPNHQKAVYTAVDVRAHEDGLSSAERELLVRDLSTAGIAYVDLSQIPDHAKDHPHKWLCEKVNEACHTDPKLDVWMLGPNGREEVSSLKSRTEAVWTYPQEAAKTLDFSKFIGSYDSAEELVLSQLGKNPVIDEVGRALAKDNPVFAAKLEHGQMDQQMSLVRDTAKPIRKDRNDLER